VLGLDARGEEEASTTPLSSEELQAAADASNSSLPVRGSRQKQYM